MSVRISATDWYPGGFDGDQAVAFAALLQAAGCDIVDVSTGQVWPDQRPAYGRSYQTPFADRIRNEAGIPTIAVGAISSYDDVNTIVLAGRADLCALARPHLYDPYWTLHAAAEQGHAVEWVPQYRSGSRRPQDGKGDGIRRAPVRQLRRGRRRGAAARSLAGGGGSSRVSRVVVVTGGTRGIGRAVAERFEAAGDQVVALGRDTCDVTDEAAVAAAFERIGRVDVLVNNAGVSNSAPLPRTSLDDWQAQMDVNATGAFLCTRAALPGMLERGSGRVVTVASTAGRAGARYTAAYTASKHAAVGLMRAVAAEVAGTGVTANAVCPTFVRTDMTQRSVERIAAVTGRGEAEAEAALAKAAPLGRLLEPEEVAFAVAFLAAAEAGAINGQTLILDGGGIQT